MSFPAPPQGRAAKKAHTRERLLHAAAEAFAAGGFASTSVDEVAARAGLTKGAVYAHFATKDDLFVALLEWWVDRRLAALQAALGDGAPATEQARDAAGWLTGFLDQDSSWSLLFFEFWLHAARDPALRRRYAAYRRTARDAVADLLDTRATKAGVTLPAPARDLATAALALASGVALERLVDPDAAGEDVVATALARLLLPPPAPDSGEHR